MRVIIEAEVLYRIAYPSQWRAPDDTNPTPDIMCNALELARKPRENKKDQWWTIILSSHYFFDHNVW